MQRKLDLHLVGLAKLGPLIWTPDGTVMTSAEFATLANERFGVPLPVNTDPIFDAIASEHLCEVNDRLRRARDGPPIQDQLEACYKA